MLETKDIDAAYKLVDRMISKADGSIRHGPFWYGWALREAFFEGVKWQASQYGEKEEHQMNRRDLKYELTRIMVLSHFGSEPVTKPTNASGILQFQNRAFEVYNNGPLFHARVDRDVALIMDLIERYTPIY